MGIAQTPHTIIPNEPLSNSAHKKNKNLKTNYSLWVYGRMDLWIWMYGYMDTWVYGCMDMDARMYGCMGMDV